MKNSISQVLYSGFFLVFVLLYQNKEATSKKPNRSLRKVILVTIFLLQSSGDYVLVGQ